MLSQLATVTSLAEARRQREHKLDTDRKPRVLFVAEEVTLAHVGRMIALASSLDARLYSVTLACGERYAHLVRQAGLRHVPIWTMSSTHFAERLSNGRAVHTKALLERYITDDFALFAREQPDLVVGDFRVSLGVSAEVAQVPYAAVVNAYWSPASAQKFPVPEHPAVRTFGLRIASVLASVIRPLTFKLYLRPFDALRRRYGLRPLRSMFDMYTHADWTLYPDVPELAPVHKLLPGHSYLGAITWEPETELPAWWNELPDDKPIVYLSIGSSGAKNILPVAIEALRDRGVTVITATAGHTTDSVGTGYSDVAGRAGPEPSEGPRNAGEPEGEDRKQAGSSAVAAYSKQLPANFFVAPYLPGMQAAARADLVICNGGSGTVYQALSQGKPVLGIPANADQYLAMQEVVRRGAGLVLRSDQLTATELRQGVAELLGDVSFIRRAQALREAVVAQDAGRSFANIVASRVSKVRQRVAGEGVAL